jgi:hypothetical protein
MQSSDISCGSISVTTALAFYSTIASRSCARSRAHGPPTAKRLCLPGANVMPIRPRTAPESTASILNGCVSLVLIIRCTALAGSAAVCISIDGSSRRDLNPGDKLLPFRTTLSARGWLMILVERVPTKAWLEFREPSGRGP